MNAAYASLLVVAIVLMQLLLAGGDGTRLIYGLPSFLLLGVLGVISVASFWRERPRVDPTCVYAVLVFSAYLLVRIFLSPVQVLARAEAFILAGVLVVYFVTSIHITESRYRVAIIAALLAMAMAQFVAGVIQFARDPGFMPFSPFPRPAGYAGRASGFFVCPDHFAAFLEVMFLMGVSLVRWGRLKAWLMVLVAYFSLLCLAGILLSGSRGGYVSTAAGLLALAALSVLTTREIAPKKFWASLAISTIAVVMLACAVMAAAYQHNFLRGRMQTALAIHKDVRPLMWRAALRQFTLAPVFGTGSRTYLIYGRQFRDPALQLDPVHAHCDYAQLLAEYGLVGLVLFGFLLWAHLRQGVRRWRRMLQNDAAVLSRVGRSNVLALQVGALSAMVAFIVHSTVDFNMHILANALLMGFVLGTLATRRGKSAEESRLPLVAMAMPPLLGVGLLVAGIPLVRAEWHTERARTAIKKTNPAGSITEAKLAIRSGAKNPDLYFYLGEANRMYATVTRLPAARSSFVRAAYDAYAAGLVLFPQDRRLAVRTAWALDKLGRFDEAEPILARARQLDPTSPVPWAYSAIHARLMGREHEALDYFRTARALDTAGTLAEEMTTMGEKFDFREPAQGVSQTPQKPSSGIRLRE
jgi:O-antigen ligase